MPVDLQWTQGVISQNSQLFMTYLLVLLLCVVLNTKSEAKEEDDDKDEMKENEGKRESPV
jgi:hypothetical protein